MELGKESREIVYNEERKIQEIYESLDERFWGEEDNRVNVAIAIYLKKGQELSLEEK